MSSPADVASVVLGAIGALYLVAAVVISFSHIMSTNHEKSVALRALAATAMAALFFRLAGWI